MNNPHTDYLLGDRQAGDRPDNPLELPPSLFAFVQKTLKVWQSSSADGAKGDEVRALFMVALANRDENEEEETSIHTDGPAEPHTQAGTLESYIDRDGFIRRADGRLLDIKPRKMSREELQRAADELTGGHDVLENRRESKEDREIQAAIDRRVARRLLSHPSNF